MKVTTAALGYITDTQVTASLSEACIIQHQKVNILDFYEAHRHTHTHPFNGPFPGLPRWAGTRKVKPIWILLKQETVSSSGSGISWALCKSAPRSRHITTPVPHHSVFYRPDALRATQPTASKHWRHKIFLWSMRWLCGLVRALDLWLKSCRFKSWRWHFQDTPLGRLFKDMPLSPSCIAWYQSKGGDSLWLGR